MAMRSIKNCLIPALLFLLAFSGIVSGQSVTFTPTEITCHGAADGTMKIIRTGGSSTYWYVYINLTDPAQSDSFGPTALTEHIFTNLPPNNLLVFYVRDAASGTYLGSYTKTFNDRPELTATVSKTNINCYGAATGTITISGASGGSGQFDYTINAGTSWQTTGNYSSLTAGTYRVWIRDRNNPGCIKILNDALVISQNAQLNATLNFANPTCFNANNGTITISAPSGGSGTGYEYTITGGAPWSGTGSYTALTPGTYNVVMRDQSIKTCTRTLNAALVLQQPAQLAVTVSIKKGLTCYEGSDAQLQANVSGGTGPYTYDWYIFNSGWVSINQHNQVATNLARGRYQVRVNDANSCGPATAGIFFIEGPAPNFAGDSIPARFFYDGAVATTACQGQTNGSIDLSAHGGVKPYRFSITTGGASGYQADSLFINLAAGTYQPWVVDKRGCKKTGADVVIGTTPNDPVSVSIAANPSGNICPGATVLFTATPVNGGTTPAYQWRVNGAPAGTNQPTFSSSTLANGAQVNVILTSSLRCTTGNPATSNTINIVHNPVTGITVQPAPVTQCEGTNATFSVTATGNNRTYQWRKNGVDIPGANSSTYTINNINATHAGNYSVRVHSDCGTDVVSNNALLTVNPATAIVTQPQSVAQCVGTNVTFTVVANGTSLTYQWRKNGVNIPGATLSTYTLTNITAPDAASYSVSIHGNCGADVVSNNAVLTVNPATVITGQPVPVTQCVGTNVSFNVTATGTNLIYQWRKDGTNIAGATGSTYTINGINSGHAGNYSVTVTGDCGPAVISNNALLTVNPATAITTQPLPVTQCVGTNATFTVVAQGTALTYQWMKNGADIPGATAASYTINNINATHAGNYSVRVHGNCGADITSNAVLLTVNPLTAITVQPAPVTQCAGTSASFSVTATGTSLTYQWMKNGTDIPGATSATYTINNINATHAGDYSVRVHGNCGADVISNNALLTVNPLTAITVQPAPLVLCEGSTAAFQVTATGTGLTYQWRKNGTSIPGATGDNYTILSITESDEASYSVVVTGNCGAAVTSNVVTLTVNPLTAITGQPVPLIQCAGTNATFSVTAIGTTLTYQWMKDGVDIPGATSGTYTINNINATHTGNYSVRVHGGCGPDVISANAALSLHPATGITQQPVGSTQCPGDSYTFDADADGVGLTYQWKKNGVNIPGATGTSFTIPNISAADAGNYSVTVTGTCGTVNSNAATLTVNSVPAITSQSGSITLCAGTDHVFSVTASGQGLTYLWRKNGVPMVPAQTASTLTLNNISSADAGSYDVVVTNDCGDATSNAAILTVAENPVIINQPGNLDLCEGGDVTFSVNASGTSITYQWRKNGNPISGETGDQLTITGVQLSDAGSYDVVISGMCDSITSTSATLDVYPATLADIVEDDTLVCAGSTVDLNVSASGYGSLSYQWQLFYYGAWIDLVNNSKYSGTMTPNLTIANTEAADSGLYRCVVFAGCGAATTEPVRLDINVIIATIGTPAPFMINSATTTIDVGIKVDDHFLLFDMGFALVAPDGTEVMLKSPIPDPCVYSSPVDINAHFTNTLPASDSMDYCAATTNITGTFGAAGDWSVLNGMDPSNGAWQVRVYDQDKSSADPDGYLTSATLTFTDLDNNGDTAIVIYNSGVINKEILNPIASELRPTSFIVPIRLSTSCFNSEDAKAVVTVQGGIAPYTYEWSGPTPEADDDEADLGPGTYTVTVTDATGCSAQATVEVSAPPAIVFDDVISTDTILCHGSAEGTIRSKASGGSGSIIYTLLPGNIASSVADSGVFTGLSAGTYTLRATDLNGCSLDTVITISENTAIVLDIQTVPVIGDEKGRITITATGGVAPYQYSIDDGTTLADSGSFTDLDAGIYQVYVIDAAGCIAVAEVNLNVEILNVDVTAHDVSCYGLADGSFYLALVDGTGPYTLTGSFTDTLVLASGAFSFTGQTAGIYDVKIEDSEGRVFMQDIVINDPSEITAEEVITDATCNMNTTDGAIDITVSGGTGTYTFEWSNGATTEDLQAVTGGSYIVEITDINGCMQAFNYFVGAHTNLPIDFFADQDIVCPDLATFFSGPDGDSVRWSPAENFADPNSSVTTFRTSSDITITYTIYDNSGCSSSDSKQILVVPKIGIDIYEVDGEFPLDDVVYLNEGESLHLEAVNGPAGYFTSYLWSPDEYISDLDTNIVTVTPVSDITYFVTATFVCPEKDSILVVLRRPLKIYTGFSPNGDEYNQEWVIENAEQYGDKIRVRVFNRWGELVFESKGYGGNNAWDGTRNGRPLPVGAYYYIIDIKDGVSKPYTGTVTILR